MYDGTGAPDYTDQDDVRSFVEYACNAGHMYEVLDACYKYALRYLPLDVSDALLQARNIEG